MSYCVAPEQIREGDLLAFAEGEASPAVRAHVARCLYCAQEAAGLQQVNSLFTVALYRAECPETEQLLGYQAGLLARAENSRIKQHAKGCAYCQAELAELVGEPSPSSLSRLATAVSQSLQEAGRQVVEAILLPAQPRPALALRGEHQQQAVYQAGPYQLILARVPPLAGGSSMAAWQLEGQLVAPVYRGSPATSFAGRVVLEQAGDAIADDVIDEFGYFALANIRPGAYRLQIEVNSSLFSIPSLTIP